MTTRKTVSTFPGGLRFWLGLMGILLAAETLVSVELENVRIRFIEAEKFYRISEYFTGEENQGGRVIVRTQPEERGGTYFILRFSERIRTLPPDTFISLDYFQPGSTSLESHRIALPKNRKSTNKLFLGVTSSEEESSTLPVAWRIGVEDASGQLLSEYKSYLWEIPEVSRSECDRRVGWIDWPMPIALATCSARLCGISSGLALGFSGVG